MLSAAGHTRMVTVVRVWVVDVVLMAAAWELCWALGRSRKQMKSLRVTLTPMVWVQTSQRRCPAPCSTPVHREFCKQSVWHSRRVEMPSLLSKLVSELSVLLLPRQAWPTPSASGSKNADTGSVTEVVVSVLVVEAVVVLSVVVKVMVVPVVVLVAEEVEAVVLVVPEEVVAVVLVVRVELEVAVVVVVLELGHSELGRSRKQVKSLRATLTPMASVHTSQRR
mmetsp:Transcript_19511/g.45767  ORF Transcript_19511/g.45767 Transcript_19511/m.45767 type:complete len:223 (-) Transcript_19511:52-720(-)